MPVKITLPVRLNEKNDKYISKIHRSKLPVAFRLDLASLDIPRPPSYLLENINNQSAVSEEIISKNPTSPRNYSIGILHGKEEKVRKPGAFSNRLTVEDFIDRCQRYSCRTFATTKTLENELREIGQSCTDEEDHSVLIQLIRDPDLSGLIHRSGDRYLLEIGRGNFVAKGTVNTSQYILDEKGTIESKILQRQLTACEVIDGYVVERRLAPDEEVVDVPEGFFQSLVEHLNLNKLNGYKSVEFVVADSTDASSAYMIDVMERSIDVTPSEFDCRVVSPGSVTGIVRKPEQPRPADKSENTILYSERPEISLLPRLNELSAENVGVIFEQASMLCHVSTILRERQIPAITLPETHDISSGDPVSIETDQESLEVEIG